jgi:hypothetical protein
MPILEMANNVRKMYRHMGTTHANTTLMCILLLELSMRRSKTGSLVRRNSQRNHHKLEGTLGFFQSIFRMCVDRPGGRAHQIVSVSVSSSRKDGNMSNFSSR